MHMLNKYLNKRLISNAVSLDSSEAQFAIAYIIYSWVQQRILKIYCVVYL